MKNKYDVVIIGAGVTGCAVARELSMQDRKILVIEKHSDVCEETSKANSGIVHAGYDAKPGTLKAKLNLLGNRKMPELAKELDFPFKQNGSLVLCFREEDRPALEELLKRGKQNQVEPLSIIEPDEIHRIEPNITDDVVAALYAPTGGIVCPFNLTVALAENAAANGVEFRLGTKVEQVARTENGYRVTISAAGEESSVDTSLVINAAGVYADVFHNMVSDKKIHITPRRGQYCLMDKKVGSYVGSTVFQLPTAYGKGILVTPTVHGNLLVGPTAEDVEDKEAVNTTAEGLAQVLSKGAVSVKELPGSRNVITSFSGLRAHEDQGDFIIGEPEDAPGFVDVAGIESPGLSCAPAIGEYVASMLQEKYPAAIKKDAVRTRKGIPSMALADEQTRQKLIQENPLYANVICRCELVTEGEIVDAINRPIGATTLDGIKRRTRAGMGRCQAGFCAPKTVEILARELHKDMSEITKCGGDSWFIQ